MNPQEISSMYEAGQNEGVAFERDSAALNTLSETLAALANTHGGLVLLGVDPRTSGVRGVRNADAAAEKALAAGLRCEPPLILPRPEQVALEGKEILLIHVPTGLPHAYGSRGRYLVRTGKKNAPLGPRQLRQLLRDRGESLFEMLPAPGSDLDDLDDAVVQEYADSFLREGSANKKQAVLDLLQRRGCLTKEDGTWHPTISGYLLFGREPQKAFPSAEILLVRYNSKEMSDEFLRETARGPLPEQIRSAERFLAANMRKGARMDSFQREDRTEYPLPAIREAIVNAVAHRDYAIRGDEIRVLLYSDRIEVYSPGRLAGHVTLQNIVEERFSRNEVIAQVLADLGFIERLGYGIDRMIRLMREWGLPAPRFAETANGFRVTLRGPGEKWITEEPEKDRWQSYSLNERQRGVLQFLENHPQVANRDYRVLFPDVSEETIRRDLADLVERGILLKMGDKRGTFYILK
ncbi:MAG: putative DNA binding domain-containing protein [Chloroflexi bacterium]|nr:putative DNA binding domain-containing protein [Chloroflexota bacterium]